MLQPSDLSMHFEETHCNHEGSFFITDLIGLALQKSAFFYMSVLGVFPTESCNTYMLDFSMPVLPYESVCL
jgi:hypothetical protein